MGKIPRHPDFSPSPPSLSPRGESDIFIPVSLERDIRHVLPQLLSFLLLWGVNLSAGSVLGSAPHPRVFHVGPSRAAVTREGKSCQVDGSEVKNLLVYIFYSMSNKDGTTVQSAAAESSVLLLHQFIPGEQERH